MFSVDGRRLSLTSLAIRASTPKPSPKPKVNDKPHPSIDDPRYSPPRPLGPVGSTVCCLYLSGSAAAHPTGCDLSRRAEGWAGLAVAIHFTADCLECSQ